MVGIEQPENWRAGVLLGARLYQLTSLKHVCLAQCESPLSFLMTAEERLRRDVRAGDAACAVLHRVLLDAEGDARRPIARSATEVPVRV